MSKHRIFVTGGNGFVGSHVVRQLIQRDYEVVCLLRKSSRTERIDNLPLIRVFGDVRNLESVEQGMKGCEGVIHLASLSSWKDIQSDLMPEVVVKGSQNVLNCAQKLGPIRTVFVSSCTAVNGTDVPSLLHEGSPFTLPKTKTFAYAHAKKKVEEYCFEMSKMGLPVIIVNPAEVYGPHDLDRVTSANLIDFAASNPILVCSGGTGIVHVDDVASGIIRAYEKGIQGERYILSSENLTIRELADITLQILDQKKRLLLFPIL
jgi:dihydroflavonol-4-reductase